ncbi:MAG: hypothetical protein M1839_003251 [Geoglossum umbratile]|nr:MAG: hypothetical protein M1839_003251 [Geoglossum umbratile]
MSFFVAWSICSVIALAVLLLGRITLVRRRARLLEALSDPTYPIEEKILETPPAKTPELPQSVTRSDEGSIGRDDWVQRLTHHVFAERHGGRYNVLTIHMNIDHLFKPDGVVERFSLTYANPKEAQVIPYDVIVFRRGYMWRFGDGGYINWCFEGNFDRFDNFVTFKEF